ncbi:hypothetical protein BCR44DRAFT_1423616, partial [Catenaria anguillulae PL171]
MRKMIDLKARIEILDWLLGVAVQFHGQPIPTHGWRNLLCAHYQSGRPDVLGWVARQLHPEPIVSFYYHARSALQVAFKHGHTQVLQCMADHGCLDMLHPEKSKPTWVTEDILFAPSQGPQCFECLEWILANGFPVGDEAHTLAKSRWGQGGTESCFRSCSSESMEQC